MPYNHLSDLVNALLAPIFHTKLLQILLSGSLWMAWASSCLEQLT